MRDASTFALVLLTMPVVARAEAPAPPVPAGCRGATLKLVEVAERCAVEGPADPPPPPAALRVELVPASPTGRRGKALRVPLKMTNTSGAPLVVSLDFASPGFVATIEPGTLRAADDCMAEALTAWRSRRPVRVVLEPKGSLVEVVELKTSFATGKRVDGGALGLEAGKPVCLPTGQTPLPPGRYPLAIALPLGDAGAAGAPAPRVLRTTVTIR